MVVIAMATKCSSEEVSLSVVTLKLGVPLVISETLLIMTLYPDEIFDSLIGDTQVFSELFDPEVEQSFGVTEAHVVHSHGDVPPPRRRTIFAADS
ncbi:unnamed protein product [Gongylonema pulchrum]|uniref:CNNM transmembrane domain-containing protein n=1 Tax=Gongylonema pulchrum TaxID=637853 RepID=A0A183E423_9BILA|nr:unnamed protein product [Gongylonema pulchrum]